MLGHVVGQYPHWDGKLGGWGQVFEGMMGQTLGELAWEKPSGVTPHPQQQP